MSKHDVRSKPGHMPYPFDPYTPSEFVFVMLCPLAIIGILFLKGIDNA